MKPKILLATFIGLVLTATIVAGAVPLTQAQTSFSNTGNNAICRNGSRDFSSFMSAILSYDDFKEYWKDIFVRYNVNPCLYSDVENLLQKIEKAREQIRKAFYVCDPNTQKLKTTYYKLEAELFFLRKYVEVSSGRIIIRPDKSVYNALRDYFVFNKSFFTEAETKKLFTDFLSKYKNRAEAYKNCADPSWENLKQKWNELTEHVSGGFGVEQAAESIGNRWEKTVNVPFKRSGNLLGGFLDAKINGLEPESAVSDILNELKENLPNGVTFSEYQQIQAQEDFRYQNDFDRAESLAQYELLYKDASGDALSNILNRLDHLDQTVKNTQPYLNQTYQCTKELLDRAC